MEEDFINKIGIFYTYWTNNYEDNLIPYVEKAARLGFDILEVHSNKITNMSSAKRHQLRDAAKKANIELTYCIGLAQEYNVASDDIRVRENGIAFLKKNVEMIYEMEGKQLAGITYGMWPGTLDDQYTSKEIALENSVNSIKQVTPLLEDYDVYFNVEVLNRFEQFLLNTCEEAVNYTKMVGSPNVNIHLDTFHLNIEEDQIGEAIIMAGEKLGHLHIGENNRRPPGRGHIPWDEVGAALKKINYQGPIVMEPFIMPGGEVGRDIRVFRDMSVGYDLNEEAKKALEFTRSMLGS